MTAAEWSDGAAGPLLRILLSATAESVAWQDLALCAEVDSELWFPDKGGSSAPAKRICMACPVRAPCLEFALDNDERHGIFGGLSERERRRLKRSRRQEAA